MTNSRRPTISNARLEAMVEEATLDCYNEEEQATGLFTMIEENLTVPFETGVLGVSVTVTSVDLTDGIQIVATCCRHGLRQAIPILAAAADPPPAGADWIALASFSRLRTPPPWCGQESIPDQVC